MLSTRPTVTAVVVKGRLTWGAGRKSSFVVVKKQYTDESD